MLDATLAPIPARLMTRAGVTRGGWSVKDILAHIVEWQQMNLDWYATGLRGEKPAMPAPGFTLREIPRLNEMSDYLRASTAAHYLWARTRIRRWWKNKREDV